MNVVDDFEVSIFLKDLSTRHSVLTKQISFTPTAPQLKSNSRKLTAGANDEPIEVGDDLFAPVILRESDDEDEIPLQNVPAAGGSDGGDDDEGQSSEDDRPTKRRRRDRTEEGDYHDSPAIEPDASTRLKVSPTDIILSDDEQEPEDDKKKLAINTSYDGFSIYGRILCLIVKRRQPVQGSVGQGTGQAMMEDWIISTQLPQEDDVGG